MKRGFLYGIIAISFFDNLSVVPILAPYARELGASPGWAGLILAGYSLTNLTGNMLSGYVLDRVGRRVPVLVGLFGTGCILLIYPAARSPAALLLVRLLHGAVVSMLTPASAAAIGDGSQPGEQARHAGRMGASIGITALVAPPVGGLVTQAWGAVMLFRLLAGLMFAATLLAAIGFRETLRERPAAARWLHPWRMIRVPVLRTAYAGTLGFTTVLGMLTVHVPLQVRALGGTMRTSGALFGVFSLLAVVLMMCVRRRRGSETEPLRRGLRVGLGLVAASALLLHLDGGWALWAGMTAFGLGFGLCFPAATGLAQNGAPDGFRGSALGVLFGLYSVGVILGQLAAGLAFDRWASAPLLSALLPAVLALYFGPIRAGQSRGVRDMLPS